MDVYSVLDEGTEVVDPGRIMDGILLDQIQEQKIIV